jgi:excisionase family DNA binding protein
LSVNTPAAALDQVAEAGEAWRGPCARRPRESTLSDSIHLLLIPMGSASLREAQQKAEFTGGNMAQSWVSVDDVAKHLGVVKESVYRWIENRGLPARRVGRLWKFRLSEVDAWVQRDSVADNPRRGAKR